jgi:flagellar biosynthesis protein FlhA
MGFVLPPVHVRDDLTLPPNQYTVLINDTVVAKAEVHADRLMAIPSPHVYGQLDGIPGIEPAYQLPVTWIDPRTRPMPWAWATRWRTASASSPPT